MLTLILPWPDPALSPNHRSRWGKVKAVNAARWEACVLAKEAGVQMRPGLVKMSLTFYPPDKRQYDLDNLGARCKAAIDGVFQALELDDHCIVELRYIRGRICKGGSVEMRIVEAK